MSYSDYNFSNSTSESSTDLTGGKVPLNRRTAWRHTKVFYLLTCLLTYSLTCASTATTFNILHYIISMKVRRVGLKRVGEKYHVTVLILVRPAQCLWLRRTVTQFLGYAVRFYGNACRSPLAWLLINAGGMTSVLCQLSLHAVSSYWP